MGQAARRHIDPLAAARDALAHGRISDGARALRLSLNGNPTPAEFDRVLELAFEFNLVDLARDFVQDAVSRYPRAAKVRHWATVLKPPAVRTVSRRVTTPHRRRAETDWLHKHADRYRGKWVVLLGGKLIASGKDLKAALRSARKRAPDAPLVHFVEK